MKVPKAVEVLDARGRDYRNSSRNLVAWYPGPDQIRNLNEAFPFPYFLRSSSRVFLSDGCTVESLTGGRQRAQRAGEDGACGVEWTPVLSWSLADPQV